MIKNKFKNYALILILTVIFTLGSTLPLGIVAALFSALTVALLGYSVTKYHYLFVGVVATCILALHTVFTQDLLSGIYLGVEIVLYGLTLGIGYNIKLSEFKTVSLLAVIYSLFVVINIKFTETGENLRAALASSLESVYVFYEGQISQADFKTVISSLLDVFMRFLPSMIIITGICFAILHFWIFKKLLKVTKTNTSLYVKFIDLHADKAITITYIVLSLISFVLPTGNYLGDALANVITVASFVFFIFGLSYVDFLLTQKMNHRVLRRIILVVLASASLPFFGIPFVTLSILGAMDGCFDCRSKLDK